MRVAVIGPTSPLRGGIVAHTEGLCVALEARGHSVERIGIQRLFPQWITRARGCLPARSRPREKTLDALAPTTWRRLADSISADVIVAQHWSPVLAPALTTLFKRVRAIRRVLVCHNFTPHEYVPGSRRLVESLLRSADAAVFHSRYVRASALARIESGRLETAVVPMPMLIAPAKGSLRPVEVSVGDCADEPLVALVGHLRRYKGLDHLAEACRLVDSDLRFHLVLAGEPLGTTRDLSRLTRLERPGIRVTVIRRYLEDAELLWLLRSAASVLLPYSRASQSGVLPLALRLSKHVVLSDAGALVEQLGESGASSVTIVPAGDPRGLARALGDIARGTREEGARAVRQSAGDGPGERGYALGWLRVAEAVVTAAYSRETGSNMSGAAASLTTAIPGDEASSRAWYHAGRLASTKAETPTT
jgi:glycosyltransferase involved in cell wall biosynthesis